jgi:hypothetical protein
VFCRNNFRLVNVKHFTLDESCQQIVFSDVSGAGYGDYIVETPIDIAHGMWLDSEKGNSSKYRRYKQAINAMPINSKGINASGIHIPKSGIKYNQLKIVIRGELINLVWPPKGFNKFKYNIRYTPVVMITNSTKIISFIIL